MAKEKGSLPNDFAGCHHVKVTSRLCRKRQTFLLEDEQYEDENSSPKCTSAGSIMRDCAVKFQSFHFSEGPAGDATR